MAVLSARGKTTDELISMAEEVSTTPDPRELDLLLATGELISCALWSMALHERGDEAISLTGPQAGITTDTGRRASPASNRFASARSSTPAGWWSSPASRARPEPRTSTLGRGGSDTSAVALAVALGAARCEIYTDVDGVYSADPRLVPDARLLPEIGFEEMLEMAHQGAKVLQTRSVELAWIHGVEIAVRHSGGGGSGTTVKEVRQMEARQKVRGIATEDQLAKLTLIGLGDRPGMAASVFAPLAEAGIPIDSIIQNVGHGGTADLSFIVPEADLDRAQHILAPVRRRSARRT